MANHSIRISDVPNIQTDFSQDCILRKYGEDCRPPFNDKFFTRTDNDVIIELEKVILSWQKSKYFTIKVLSFHVETSHIKIEEMLRNHNNERNKNKSSSKKRGEINDSEYINLKDSDVMLLVVNYYIEVFNKTGPNKDRETSKTLQVLILVPRIVDQYFLHIYGNYYCPTYQIVDGSIYNNSDKSQSTQRRDMVSFKAERPIRILRKKQNLIEYDGTPVTGCVMYTCNILNSPGIVMPYFFAKFGLQHAMGFLGVDHIMLHRGLPANVVEMSETHHVFSTMNQNIYISVPRVLFDNDYITQSIVCTLCKHIQENTSLTSLYTAEYWCKVIGNSKNAIARKKKEKIDPTELQNPKNGERFLYKLESIYSIKNYELLKLPHEHKATIYHVIRWMIREFPNLRGRDNIDIFYKRIQYSKYIAMFYAAKLSTSIIRICEVRENILTLDFIERAIYTKPDMLLHAISKDSLKNNINRVNDNFAFTVLKASYKGVSNIGEKSKKQVSDRYRNVHYSHAGVLDMTSSSASDPGMTTLLCPLGNIEDDGFFYDYEEPNTWEEAYNELLANYHKSMQLQSMVIAENALLDKPTNYFCEEALMIDSITQMKRMLVPIVDTRHLTSMVDEIAIDENGEIIYDENGWEYEEF